METSSIPPSRSDFQIPPAVGYSAAALAAWIFRRPILALTGFAIRLALALVKPTLLALGAVQLSHLLQKSREISSIPPQPTYPGDDEALLVPARSLSPTSSATSGLEV